MSNMTAKEYRLLMDRKATTQKYRNVRMYIYSGGIPSSVKDPSLGDVELVFDSKKEYSRWLELKMLERAGVITSLELQKPLVIQGEVIRKDGQVIRPIVYKADFMYVENGTVIVEDVKGIDSRTGKAITTDVFALKWKLLQALYPDYEFVVV